VQGVKRRETEMVRNPWACEERIDMKWTVKMLTVGCWLQIQWGHWRVYRIIWHVPSRSPIL